MQDAAADTAGAAPATAPAAEPSAAQQLFGGLGELWTNLSSLTPEVIAVNLGLSLLILIVTGLVIWGLRKLIQIGLKRLLHRAPEDEAEDGAAETSPAHSSAAQWTWRLIQLVVFATAAVLVLSVWGLDLITWLTAGSGVVLTRLVMVLLLAAGAVEVVSYLLARVSRRFEGRAKDPRRAQQVRTLMPILRGVVQGVIVVIAGLTVLSQVGVQIAPLLASAGVVGVAVGFGAQTLVKDFLTGLFLVVEDIVSVGDNVSIGDSQGTVEAMTLRTIRLRAMNGTLHVFPYSEAQVIHNHTKTFSAYVFEFGIGYGSDIDKALEIIQRHGEEMARDPAWSDVILQPLDIFGVDRLADSSVVLKARFRTNPGDQWRVGREFNRRVKLAFDREGIEIPFPYTKIVYDGPAAPPAPSAPSKPLTSDAGDGSGSPQSEA